MSEIILVNVTGKDRTGLVARVTGALAEHGVHILDVGQAVIDDYISLGLLVEIPAADPAPLALKDSALRGP
jgi:phosphoserine phosphatase